jgi:hypothetical protein
MDADLAALRVQQTLMVPLVAETAVGEPGTVTPEEDASDPGPESPEEISTSSRYAPRESLPALRMAMRMRF